jgi:hypothetical protein
MIDPGIWRSEQVNNLSRDARLLFIGIFSNADDEGRLHGSARFLKANIFPYDEDVTAAVVQTWRGEVIQAGLCALYWNDGREYLHLPTWSRHQRIDRPSKSTLPAPDDSDDTPGTPDEDSSNVRRVISEGSSLIEDKGIEEKGIEEAPTGATSLDDLNPLEDEVANLKGWGSFTMDDRAWLEELLGDFKGTLPADIRDCRDWNMAHRKTHTKKQWKTRLRNWLGHKAEWRKDGKGMPGNGPTGAFSGITA